ncbi:MAG: substrate-binding domain-containing protein [Kiritimatiellae bacterium]|nr:substrate-binding domain-containing protein [Kiritimatiellia bacterium]
MTNRPRSKTYDVLAVSSTVHKANADYLAGILRYASGRQDWRLWLFNPLADYSYGDVLPASRASGVIANGLDEVPLESLRPRNRRACVVISDCAADSGVSSVLCDNVAVARAAADFFLSRKFRNFAFAEAPLPEAFSVERLDAFAAAVSPGCSTFTNLSAGSPDFAKWLRRLPRPCALFAANDRIAKVAADICRVSGIRVPQEIAILGVDDEEMVCNFTSPTLSSVRPAFDAGGYMAAELLDSIMRGKTRKEVHLRYGVTGIVERDSTAISSAEVSSSSALEAYIRQHARAEMTPETAVRAVGRDGVRIRRAYREAYGRTVCRGIQEARLREVQKLLVKTRVPIGDIGRMCGFGNEFYLKTLFKARFGMTMSQWRKTHAN